jgi:hypothetical protein
MTNPNQPTQPLPINPNVNPGGPGNPNTYTQPPAPGAEIPQPGAELSGAEYTRNEYDILHADAAEAQNLTKIVLSMEAQGHMFTQHPNQQQTDRQRAFMAELQQHRARLNQIKGNIKDVVRRGDSTHLIEKLEHEVGHRSDVQDAFDDGVLAADDRIENATQSHAATVIRRRNHTEQRLHGQRTPRDSSHAGSPAFQTDSSDSRIRQRAANNVQRRLRSADRRLGMDVVNSGDELRKAEAGSARAEARANRGSRYSNFLETLTTELRTEHDATRVEIDTKLDTVEQTLELWNLNGHEPSADSGQRMREILAEAAQKLGDYSPYDSDRATQFENIVVLRYRLEQRGLNNTASSIGNTARYTPDKGILVNAGTSEEAVIYEDATVARPDQATGQYTRNDASGRELEIPVPTSDLPPANHRPDVRNDMGKIMSDWERDRTPQAAAEVHADLSNRLHHNNAEQDVITNELNVIDQQIQDVQQFITQHQNDPTKYQEVMAANNRLTQLNNDGRARYNRRLSLRQRANQMVYTDSFVTMGTSAAEGVSMVNVGGNQSAIRRENYTMNGQTGNWLVYPDGRSSLERTDQNGNPVLNAQGQKMLRHFHRDGTPV